MEGEEFVLRREIFLYSINLLILTLKQNILNENELLKIKKKLPNIVNEIINLTDIGEIKKKMQEIPENDLKVFNCQLHNILIDFGYS